MTVVPALREARFEALVALVAADVRRYALRRTDQDTAEDVLAETLLVLWRRLDDVPEGAELPWTYAVARRCLANSERSRRRQRNLVDRIAGTADRAAVGPGPEDIDLPDPALHAALARLREADREVLRLWAWEDLAPAEIAVVLDTTPNAVSIRLHRAKRRLAAELGRTAVGKEERPAGQTRDERRTR